MLKHFFLKYHYLSYHRENYAKQIQICLENDQNYKAFSSHIFLCAILELCGDFGRAVLMGVFK